MLCLKILYSVNWLLVRNKKQKTISVNEWLYLWMLFNVFSEPLSSNKDHFFFPATRWGRKGKGSLNLPVLNVHCFHGSLILLSCPHAVQLHYDLRTIWIYRRIYMMDWSELGALEILSTCIYCESRKNSLNFKA